MFKISNDTLWPQVSHLMREAVSQQEFIPGGQEYV